MSEFRYLWIFHVIGGNPCNVQLAGNPVMKHDGSRNVVRCLCTDEEAEQAKRIFEEAGATVQTNSPRETVEQTEERNNLFAVLGGDTDVWPTPNCPTCSWFDHQVKGFCGAGMLGWRGLPGWDASVLAERKREPKFKKDYKACPLFPLVRPHDD